MTIYIDNEFKCHMAYMDGLIKIETNFFNEKCLEFIEGYRFIPAGETWTREDGTTFKGEMIAPWKPYNELSMAQHKYEVQQLSELKEAFNILLGGEE